MNLGTPEKPLDYRGGRLTDSDHSGVDFALQDRKDFEKGVEVLAVADGVVVGIRNEMLDTGVTSPESMKQVKGRECGNGIMIDHGQGVKTQYCHMKLNSIKVTLNQKVKADQPLGLVGLSGLTEYPHLHLTTFFQDKKIDPFIGIPKNEESSTTKIPPRPLWREQVLKQMPYEAGVIYNFGIASEKPDVQRVRQGLFRDIKELRSPSLIVGWVELFMVNAGDKISLSVLDPKNQVFTQHTESPQTYKARLYIYVGKRKPPGGWLSGTWKFRVNYESQDGKSEHQKEMSFLVK
ncbi:MAG TPA: M23 family metallopeptidase [Candidatus Nitrosotenuis sp.]|jgi:hypothetical protein|nr:M23 family metallopeptidase [Candidatus Nitrosotenuis sp.]